LSSPSDPNQIWHWSSLLDTATKSQHPHRTSSATPPPLSLLRRASLQHPREPPHEQDLPLSSPSVSSQRPPLAASVPTTSLSTARPKVGPRKLSKPSDAEVMKEWQAKRAREADVPRHWSHRLFAHAE
jgi:hypothetical protein